MIYALMTNKEVAACSSKLLIIELCLVIPLLIGINPCFSSSSEGDNRAAGSGSGESCGEGFR